MPVAMESIRPAAEAAIGHDAAAFDRLPVRTGNNDRNSSGTARPSRRKTHRYRADRGRTHHGQDNAARTLHGMAPGTMRHRVSLIPNWRGKRKRIVLHDANGSTSRRRHVARCRGMVVADQGERDSRAWRRRLEEACSDLGSTTRCFLRSRRLPIQVWHPPNKTPAICGGVQSEVAS